MNNKVLIFGLVGESMFMTTDHFHHDGETIIVDDIYREAGGKGYNQAITCRMQGIDTCFVSMVGSDVFGYNACDYLDKIGINNKIIIKDNKKSAFATILTNKKGENRVSVYPGVIEELTEDDICNLEYLFDEYSYVLIQLELSEIVTKKIIELANIHKCKIILNPAPYKTYLNDILYKVDILTPNYSEALKMLQLDEEVNYDVLAHKFITKGLKNVIITLGKDGALLIQNNKYKIIPSNLVDQSKVVDTTGAGDVFNGALVSSMIKGRTLEEAVIYANKASSYSIKQHYVIPSIPSKCDIEDEDIYQKDIYFPYQEKDNTRNTVRAFAQNEEGKFGFIRIQGIDEFGNRDHLESPGGGIEFGGCQVDAIIREVKEELGYNCKVISKICTVIHEFNLIKRITYANYYYVLVDTKQCETNYTENEKKLFKGIEWYTLDELEIELNKPNNKVGSIVHERELLALEKMKKHIKI